MAVGGISRAAAMAGRWARPALDFALPPRCAGCGVIIEDDHRFCLDCWSGLHLLGEPCCARCGLPLPFEEEPGAQCGACLAVPPPFETMRAAMGYGAAARHVAMRLKYGRRVGLARLMGGLMARHLPQGGAERLLLPVPLHRWRLWGRGFNQSVLIAQDLARRSGIPLDRHVLRRVRATPPLYRLAPREREAAVRGAFALDPARKSLVAGRTIILVDDIFTSGATARACAQLLHGACAQAVHLLCWARVLPSDAAENAE